MINYYVSLIENYLRKEIWHYTYIDSWWDYNVILTNNLVFRFPKNPNQWNVFAEEKRRLDIIKKYITIKIPEYIHIDQNMIVYKEIQWKNMKEFSLKNLEQIINFLKELHSISIQEVMTKKEEKDNNQLDKFVSYMKERIEERLFKKHIDKNVILAIHSYMDELFFSFESPFQSFIHWDLQPKNIIVSYTGKVEGIIDFSDSRIGSCELDFCHILDGSKYLCKKSIEMYLWNYNHSFFERVFFLSRRNVIFQIDNDDLYNNHFNEIYQSLNKYNFLSS